MEPFIARALEVLAAGSKVREKVDTDALINNTMDHYRNATPDQQQDGRWWYRAAHDATNDTSRVSINDPGRSAAVMAALSPHEEWGNNLQNGMHFLLNYDPTRKHDWQQPLIHPQVHEKWMANHGKAPSSPQEMEAYADAHGETYPEMADPAVRKDWLDGMNHWGYDTQLARMERSQVMARKKKSKRTGLPNEYDPKQAIGHAGLPTIGGNVERAKNIFNAPTGQYEQFLNGPKVNSFYRNIADKTPMDDDGYYHDLSDQDAVIDTHMVRAMAQPHGNTLETRYLAPPEFGANEIDPQTRERVPVGYNIYRGAVQEATKRLNAERAQNGEKPLTPKQVQATVWLKFKDDIDKQKWDANAEKFEKKNPGKTYPGPQKADLSKYPLSWPRPNYTPDHGEAPDPRRDAPDLRSRPNWMRPLTSPRAARILADARWVLTLSERFRA